MILIEFYRIVHIKSLWCIKYTDTISAGGPIMRLVIFMITLLLVFNLSYSASGQANVSVSANNAVLIEQSSGRILYEKNAHDIQSIASITKIMTAIIAIESGMMDETTKTSRRALYTEGSSIYLEQGEKMLIEDLVYGLMLRSGNDASVAIGEHIAGSVEGFVSLMNEKARWLGMTNTHFDNPHGLDSDNHYSTAYDMALLMRYAMDNEQFRKISGTTFYQAQSRSYGWKNKNKLLTSLYENCTGGKTGYTKKTGRTLATTASKDGLDLISVTLNAPDDWRDHIQMYEWGFKNYQLQSIAEKGTSRYKIKGTNNNIVGFTQNDILFPLTETEMVEMYHNTFLLFPKKDFDEGDLIGKTIYYIDALPIVEIPIYSYKNDTGKKNSFFSDVIFNFKQVSGLR